MRKLLRLPDVCGAVGKSKSALYQAISAGLFVPAVPISSRAVAWPDDEVSALIDARIAGATEDELRELVAELIRNRKRAAPTRAPEVAHDAVAG